MSYWNPPYSLVDAATRALKAIAAYYEAKLEQLEKEK